MPKNNLVILKLGGSVITDKKNNRKKINKNNLERISKEITEAMSKKGFSLIIVHGVGSYGHVIAKKFNLSNGYKNKHQIQAVAELYCDLKELNLEVIKTIKSRGMDVIPFQQSSAWKSHNKEISNPNLDVIKNYLALGFTPVLHGDLMTDDKLGFSVLSGDKIVYYLARKLKARRVILGTDIDGVFDADPNINKKAKLMKIVNSKNINNLLIGKSIAMDVTGGMSGKVKELLKLAELGIESEIINISKSNILKKSLCGQKDLGTIIKK
jgi:isopentenyl phosphate kinase